MYRCRYSGQGPPHILRQLVHIGWSTGGTVFQRDACLWDSTTPEIWTPSPSGQNKWPCFHHWSLSSVCISCRAHLSFQMVAKKDQSKKKKKKLVYILSTIHTAMEGYSGRHERDEDRTPIYKPKAVLDYIKQMGGVDLSDQLMNYYHFLRRSNKWWRKLWVHIFNMALLNAYILNKTYGIRKQLTHHEYRYLLALTLLGRTEPVRQPPLHALPLVKDTGQRNSQNPAKQTRLCYKSARGALLAKKLQTRPGVPDMRNLHQLYAQLVKCLSV